jgi:ATP-dependent Lhr-like helicase
MFQVYTAEEAPSFLDAGARELLAEGRAQFRRHGLDRNRLLAHGGDTLLFCWRGDRVLDTLAVQLAGRGLEVSEDGLALAVLDTTPQALAGHLRALAEAGPADALGLAASVAVTRTEKHDVYLDDTLAAAGYAARSLDPQGAWQTLQELTTVLQARPDR